MKLLERTFKGLKSDSDYNAIESYYGHGTQVHESLTHSHADEEHNTSGKYKCPMGCEGEKVCDSPGNCPVCNMKLVPVKE